MESFIHKYQNLEKLSLSAAEFVTQKALDAVRKQGFFTFALSGGNTPEKLYRNLTSNPLIMKFPWTETYFFWSDERFVTPDYPESNFALAQRGMLHKVPVDPKKIFPVPVEAGSVEKAALEYEETLRRTFSSLVPQSENKFPRFDLVLLGLGADGHTASLFPGNPVLEEQNRLAVPVTAPAGYKTRERVSFTLPLINSSACVVFLAAGQEKNKIIRAILDNNAEASEFYPAAKVQPVQGELHWFLDNQAGT